jgi:hypothetical protein
MGILRSPPKIDTREIGKTGMAHSIWAKALEMESPDGIRIAPAPMMISGDGIGTMICSIITPMKTEG